MPPRKTRRGLRSPRRSCANNDAINSSSLPMLCATIPMRTSSVIPAQAGIHLALTHLRVRMDPRLRGDDGFRQLRRNRSRASFMAILLLLVVHRAHAADLLIQNARLIDGTGSPPRTSMSVLVRNG